MVTADWLCCYTASAGCAQAVQECQAVLPVLLQSKEGGYESAFKG